MSLVISGGQTGADQGALRAAKSLDIATGGWAPRDYRTETGVNQDLRTVYGLDEWDSSNYKARTLQNVLLGDATLIIGKRSPGSNATEEFCRIHMKSWGWRMIGCAWPRNIIWHMQNDQAIVFTMRWLKENNVKTLNVAGNRESVNPGIEEYTFNFIRRILE